VALVLISIPLALLSAGRAEPWVSGGLGATNFAIGYEAASRIVFIADAALRRTPTPTPTTRSIG